MKCEEWRKSHETAPFTIIEKSHNFAGSGNSRVLQLLPSNLNTDTKISGSIYIFQDKSVWDSNLGLKMPKNSLVYILIQIHSLTVIYLL